MRIVAGLMRVRAILGNSAAVVHSAEGRFDLSGWETAVEAIITPRPMNHEELEHTLAHCFVRSQSFVVAYLSFRRERNIACCVSGFA